MEQSLREATLHLQNVHNFNEELVYNDEIVVSYGEVIDNILDIYCLCSIIIFFKPAALFWTNPYQTVYERQMTDNATMAIYAQQFYRGKNLKSLSLSNQLSELNKLTDCVPEMYRCNQLRQKCQNDEP